MPSSVCAKCEKDKILLPQVPIQPDSHYSITEKGSKISLCRQCSEFVKKSTAHYNFFNNFSCIPPCIKLLDNYGQYRNLSIGTLFCSTFRTQGYTYVHMHVKLSCGPSPAGKEGMLGILHNSEDIPSGNNVLKPSLQWLKKHNVMYSSYLANFEIIPGHFTAKYVHNSFPGMPQCTTDITFEGTGQISQSEIKQSSRLIIPSENVVPPISNGDSYVVGESVSRTVHQSNGSDFKPTAKLLSSDENLEAKVFPHLFPDGHGSWSKQKQALTLGQYHKHRLMHMDRRWANDKFYLFFAFDRNMKQRFCLIQKYQPYQISIERISQQQMKLGKLKRFIYDKYGHVLPASVTKGLATNQCKYGFPYSLRDDDGYAADNLRYEYKRLNPQDSRVVSYNPYILYMWDAHINVQHVTRSGLEKYLVKYVAKVEPTFGLTVKDNHVSSYFETRIVGAPEAAAAVMSHHFVSSTRQVIFIDTNLKSERRVLKPYEQLQTSEGDGTDIFIKGPRDFCEQRPSTDICSNLTLVEYLSDCEIFTFRSKIPKNRQSNIYTDVQARYVVRRIKSLIPRYRFLTPLDSEAFYFQTLLLNVSYRSENELLSQENTSQTFKEECYLKSLFDASDALDIVFSELLILNAALLINGRTVHSFFKLDPELNTSLGYNDNTWQVHLLLK
ncbi:unnamed protein product [Mytilus coruscus]|uniref:Helitron helicase-like domain-containing protein n=1 Tax=Mytilus coruscus TaxID=42192 RepID=A0A6J8DUV2_MYTCO|nr:unnamed protein product [Mytilus coruscus]